MTRTRLERVFLWTIVKTGTTLPHLDLFDGCRNQGIAPDHPLLFTGKIDTPNRVCLNDLFPIPKIPHGPGLWVRYLQFWIKYPQEVQAPIIGQHMAIDLFGDLCYLCPARTVWSEAKSLNSVLGRIPTCPENSAQPEQAKNADQTPLVQQRCQQDEDQRQGPIANT